MGLLGRFLGSSAAEPIAAVGKAIDDVFTSDEERLTRQEAIARIKTSPHLKALEGALIEARSEDSFVSRARPYGLYVFWSVFGLQSGLLPVVWWIWQTFDKTLAPPPAVLAASDVMTVMAGILGTTWIAGRTVEKVQGKT